MVLAIPHQGQADMSQLYPDLVVASGDQMDLQQGLVSCRVCLQAGVVENCLFGSLSAWLYHR